jgi:hypothetical protein
MTAVLERVREDVVALAPPEPTIHWQQRVWRRATVHTLAHGGYPRFRLLLLGCYAFFLPVQIALGPTRLAFSDPFILLYLGLYGLGVRKAKGAWSSWYPALLAVMNFGIFVALVRTGSVTSYALIQKAAGLAFLMVTVAALVDFMRTAPRARWLLTVFVKGVVVNSVIAVAAYGIQKADQSALGFINYEGVRLSGFAIDPNAYGGLIDCA